MMNIQERSEAFALAFPKWPASWPTVVVEQGRLVLYAIWMLGNDYRATSSLYGAYPPNYLKRVRALFHAFRGSLPSGPYSRCDAVREAEYPMPIDKLPEAVSAPFRLVYADPPYSAEDAKRYGPKMIHRGRTMRHLAQVTAPHGHLVWLDTIWPMHRKAEWLTVGRIAIVRSTGHRVRMCTIFRRVG